jgi:hypothetical protein
MIDTSPCITEYRSADRQGWDPCGSMFVVAFSFLPVACVHVSAAPEAFLCACAEHGLQDLVLLSGSLSFSRSLVQHEPPVHSFSVNLSLTRLLCFPSISRAPVLPYLECEPRPISSIRTSNKDTCLCAPRLLAGTPRARSRTLPTIQIRLRVSYECMPRFTWFPHNPHFAAVVGGGVLYFVCKLEFGKRCHWRYNAASGCGSRAHKNVMLTLFSVLG